MGLEHDLKRTVADAIIEFERTGNTLYFCNIYEFKLMLSDGANHTKLNQKTACLEYAHQAIYKGLEFAAITKKKISDNRLYNPGIFKSNI